MIQMETLTILEFSLEFLSASLISLRIHPEGHLESISLSPAIGDPFRKASVG